MEPLLYVWLLLVLFSVVPAAWLVSRLGPWRKLPTLYPAAERRPGAAGFWSVARAHGNHARGTTLRMHADDAHLHVRHILPLFHPPFSIPWSEIAASQTRIGLLDIRAVALRFARDPGVPFFVSRSAFDRIAAASAGRLRLEETVADGLQG